MFKIRKHNLIIILFIFININAFPQKTERHLNKIKNIMTEIENKNKELEEYSNKMEELNFKIRNIKKDFNTTSSKKNQLEKKISNTQLIINQTKERYELLKKMYGDILKEMKNDSSYLYLSNFSYSEYYGFSDLIKEIVSRNAILRKSYLAKQVDNKTHETQNNIKKLLIKKQRINQEKTFLQQRLKKNNLELKKNQKNVEMNKKKIKSLNKEIKRLKKSAQDLTDLVKRLEKQTPYKKSMTKTLNIKKHSLIWPVEGKIISKFGREYISELKTYLIRDGIRIKSYKDFIVRPVMPGEVIYAGSFRNYGNLIIIRHEDNVFTSYGLLNIINVKVGDIVDQTTSLGNLGEDFQSVEKKGNNKNVLYFEIRKGSEALNPLEWLK